MSLLLSTTLLATVVTAQLTTSIWLPGAANANQSFVGSVVSLQSDRTTLSLAFDGDAIETEYYGSGPNLVTVGGATYMAYEASAYQPVTSSPSYEEKYLAATVRLECTRQKSDAVPACATTIQGVGLNNSVLALDSDAVRTTMTISGELQQNYASEFKLVLTAGTEKLSASVAASPTEATVESTGTQSGIQLVNPSSGPPEPTQATGAAGPLRSMRPILAGLGAAVVFFV
ncbi:hypothetical protein SVAN01_02634 [Stagonosporopsis vannaccii]|nr:hypothetical protein SVAN01_02634 [Stagonosporopsis vannaccii]